jgi:hypothetical protein
VTSAGTLKLARVYFLCSSCTVGGFPLDERLGVAGRYSPQAQRLICLAGGSWSYDMAAERLKELSGLDVSDTTIRELSQEHGARMNEWQRTDKAATQAFREAEGDIEFTSDGTCVNTTEGWREMRIGIYSKRQRGPAATPDEWDSRELPAAEGRVAFAAIEDSERFGSRWDQWAARLGIRDYSRIHFLADGAKCLWEELRKNLIGATGTLDIYHAQEHIAATAKSVFPDASEAAGWEARTCAALRRLGLSGVEEQMRCALDGATSSGRKALANLQGYLGNHVDHLNYRIRLAEGRSIGSGQVEGACKHMIGRRLKQTGGRWRIRRVNRMAGLCCCLYSHNWDAYWATLGV